MLLFYHLLLLSLLLLGLIVQSTGLKHTKEQIEALRKNKVCTNLEEVKRSVNFLNVRRDPYPPLWYDTRIEYSKNCYVEFESEEKTHYRLVNLEAGLGKNPKENTHLTHYGPCGVCSQLQDLAAYIDMPDLTTPVRKCSFRILESNRLACLRDIGFSEDCSWIWYWNTKNTGKPHAQGGCLGTCLIRIFQSNNSPAGKYNPCKPMRNITGNSFVDLIDRNIASSYEELLKAEEDLENSAMPKLTVTEAEKGFSAASKGLEDKGECGNTINEKAVCSPDQWQNGPYRLNACLQCDECRSGPIFQKIAGRTRRASGIASAISRDGVPELTHDYG